MASRRILIVYGTSYGQTAKIAQRMADQLKASGDAVTLVAATTMPPSLTLSGFDGIIVGSSVIRGRHQRSVVRFVRAHRAALSVVPSAFFSVSGAAASREAASQTEARRFVSEFVQETGWHPGLTEAIAGAMAYTKYNPILRWIVKRAAKAMGGPTDTSRDYELTDWSQVQRFVERFLASLPASEATDAMATSCAGGSRRRRSGGEGRSPVAHADAPSRFVLGADADLYRRLTPRRPGARHVLV